MATPNRSRSEAKDFNDLKDIGFELESPQDEFSFQPASGSSIGGTIGKQEYGIDSDLDSESRENEYLELTSSIEDPMVEIPGESNWSQAHRLPEEDLEIPRVTVANDELKQLIEKRLGDHPHLKNVRFATVVEERTVTVSGVVSTDALKLLVTEMVEALPGVYDVVNEVEVRAQQ